MRLPLLVFAVPYIGLKGNTTISSGRWRIEFEGKKLPFFKFLLFSPAYPEGFEFDIYGDKAEFYVECSTKVTCELIEKPDDNEHVSLFLRRVGDGLQHFSNEKRA